MSDWQAKLGGQKMADIKEMESNNNFIHNIIDKDLESGKIKDTVYTRFPPEPGV